MKKLFLTSILISALVFISCSKSNEQKVDIVGQEVEYNSEGTVLKGYLAYDKNIEGKRPGVLVVHEW